MAKVDRLLPETEQEKIQNAVSDVEKVTSGEVVPLITEASDEYPAAIWRGGVLLGVLAASLTTFLLGPNRLWTGMNFVDLWIFPAAFLAFALAGAFLLMVFPALKRPFITRSEMNNAVAKSVFSEFMLNGLAKTRDRTGILIYISLLEHRVQIFADEGINKKVEEGTWQKEVETIVKGIKEKNFSDSLVKAIKDCGKVLAENFPPRPDDTDELKNLIIK